MVAFEYMRSLRVELTVTQTRSILKTGFFYRGTKEIRHSDVRLLTVDQSPFQRLLSVGDITISSAGTAEKEMSIVGLRDPEMVKETIDQLRPA